MRSEPSTEHWRSPYIKVDSPPYSEPPATPEEFDKLADEGFAEDEPCLVYVEVWNRDVEPMEDPSLTVSAGPATTTLPRPSDESSGWRELGTVRIGRIEPGEAYIGRFEVPAGHQCLVAIVEVPGKPGPSLDLPADRIVAAGDALARNMDIVGSRFERVLIMRNPTPSAGRATLEVRASPEVKTSQRGLDDSTVELAPGEQRELTLEAAAPAGTEGEVSVLQRIELEDEEPLEGGFTYIIRP